LFLRYTQALITQTTQTAACNRHHSVEQQLCRWLLSTLDRVPTRELVITQELVASMLGVRREGITEAAGKLQHAGFIRYRRGHIAVLDRIGLETRAVNATRWSSGTGADCADVRLRRRLLRSPDSHLPPHRFRCGCVGEFSVCRCYCGPGNDRCLVGSDIGHAPHVRGFGLFTQESPGRSVSHGPWRSSIGVSVDPAIRFACCTL
jgi:hypothetical protein